MEAQDKILFKNHLKHFCRNTIEQRIAAAKEMIQNAREAANSEEKSSAGDKYETGRAMGHLQQDMHARQLAGYIKEMAGLHAINSSLLYDCVTPGAFIETTIALFFVAAGLGKQVMEGKTIFFLSPRTPLAIALLDKKIGDSFYFNGERGVITNLF
ncbi:MAG: hypothetical protein ABI813_06350 [Bacteroidota bacterium]